MDKFYLSTIPGMELFKIREQLPPNERAFLYEVLPNNTRIPGPYYHLRDNYYVGRASISQNEELLKKEDFTHVLNCASDVYLAHKEVKCANLNIDDFLIPINKYFQSAFALLDAWGDEQNSKILIACQLGINRSMTISIAYMMQRYRTRLYDTTMKIYTERPYGMLWNTHFTDILCAYDKMLFSTV
jgi:hypothetical protein